MPTTLKFYGSTMPVLGGAAIRHEATYASTYAYEPETQVHADRVAADGGQGVVLMYLDQAIKMLKTAGIYSGANAFKGWWDPRFGYKLNGSSQVIKAYSPDPAQRDMLPVASYNGPTVLTASASSAGIYGGIPRFFFNMAVLGFPSFPLGPSQYTIGALLSSVISMDDNHLIGYGPDDASFIEIRYYSGKMRAHHTIGYNGTEAAQATNYDGSAVRISSRWLASRTSPSDIIATANGEMMGYVSNNPKPALTTMQQNKLLTIGAGTFYGSLSRAANLNLYSSYVLAGEDATAAAAVDNFLKSQFGMPA